MSDGKPFEATSKPLKLLQLLGVLIVLGSVSAGFLYRHDVGLRRAMVGGAVGIGVHVLGRFLAWWRHG